MIGPIDFDQAETDLLLAGKSIKEFSGPLKRKVKFLGMDQWLNAIPRNIKVLLEKNQPDIK